MISQKVLLIADKKGYRVNREGDVLYKGNVRNVRLNKNGYKYFMIRCVIDGRSVIREVLVHRLQAYQKYGDNMFNEKMQVRHLNSIRADNTFDNIVIGTSHQNRMDMLKEDRIKLASHPVYDHEAILDDRELGMSYNQLVGKYGIRSKGALNYIINDSLEKNTRGGIKIV